MKGSSPTTLRYFARASSRLLRNSARVRASVFDPLPGLFEIPFARPPARKARVHIREYLLVADNVLLAEAHQPQIPYHIDVSFSRVERDQFRPLANAKRRSVDPSRLTPDVMDRCKPVEKDLPDDH